MMMMHNDNDSRELSDAIATLNWLAAHGALGGVAAIARERRRQIERGYDGSHDDHLTDGYLAGQAAVTALHAVFDSGEHDPDVEIVAAGALCAAESDRLFRMMDASVPHE